MNIRVGPYGTLAIIIVLFVVVSVLVQTNMDFFEAAIGDSASGMVLYVLFVASMMVILPASALPILPLVVALWGPFVAALLSIAGWFIGATIAFELSRAYGKDLIGRIANLSAVERVSEKVIGTHGFLKLVLLRMVVPVDILSYALGLFTSIDRRLYYSTTAIGIVPFAFPLAYFGGLDWAWQLAIIASAALVVLVVIATRRGWKSMKS